MSLLAGLYSPRADRLYQPRPDRYICAESGGYLKPVYDYKTLSETLDFDSAFAGENLPGLGRYIDLLPFNRPGNLPLLPSGQTPLVQFSSLSSAGKTYLKLENYNLAGGSYSRALAVMTGMARENEFPGLIVAPRPGRAVATARLVNSTGLKPVMVVQSSQLDQKPELTTEASGTIIAVDKKNYEEIFELVNQTARESEFYNCNEIYNPYAREGYKTIAFELARSPVEPDTVFIPTVTGCLLAGIYKGFNELKTLGWISEMPRLISVEIPPESYIAAGFKSKNETRREEFEDTVRRSVDGYFAREALEKSGGEALVVGEKRLKEAEKLCSNELGLNLSRRSLAGLAGWLEFKKKINPEAETIILLDGQEKKDTENPDPVPVHRLEESENLEQVLDEIISGEE